MHVQQTLDYPPCYLVGARASGKSAMGALLAQALTAALTSESSTPPLRWCCLDTDDLFVRAFDESIADFVARMGFPAFRQRENQALRAATAPATVLATGGGCILDPANRQFMRAQGCVLYLCAPAEVLVERLLAEPLHEQRPPLFPPETGLNAAPPTELNAETLSAEALRAEVAQVLAERDPLYREAAHAVVNASGSVAEVLRDLLHGYSTYLSDSARAPS